MYIPPSRLPPLHRRLVRLLRPPRVRTAAAVVGIVVATAGVVALLQLRSATLEAEARERAEAREAFADEVTAVTAALTAPLLEVEAAAQPALGALAETLTGTDRAREAVQTDLDRAVAQLLAAAARLEEASQLPLPARPRVLPVGDVDPPLERLRLLQELAVDVAEGVRSAAVAAHGYGAAAQRLADAAATFASAAEELPDTDDPDDIADAWRDELDGLAEYRSAIDLAAQAPGLEPLVAVHRDLVDMVWALAEASIDDLEEGDIDAYNERLEAALEEQNAEEVGEALVAASRQALRGPGVTDLEDARVRAEALHAEIELFEAELPEALDPDAPVVPP